MAQKKPTVYEFIPKLGQLRDDVLFGDVWEHPDLSKRDRSLITVAIWRRSIGPTRCRYTQKALDNRSDGDRAEEDHPCRVLCRLALPVSRAYRHRCRGPK